MGAEALTRENGLRKSGLSGRMSAVCWEYERLDAVEHGADRSHVLLQRALSRDLFGGRSG
jgi:hypothetical protein